MVHISGSIFTTVAVALERFTATYRPHYYNQIIKNVNGHSRRLFKYTLTISALAIIFNIPKFFETEIILMNKNDRTYSISVALKELNKRSKVPVASCR